jgi:hypothetical protein
VSAAKFDAQLLKNAIGAPGLRGGVSEPPFLIGRERPIWLVPQVVVRLRPRVLKHRFDLKFKESRHLIDRNALWNDVSRRWQDQVLSEVAKRPLRLWNELSLLNRTEVSRDRLDCALYISTIENDNPRAE